MSEAIIVTLITTMGAAVASAFAAWAAVRKSRIETEKKIDLVLYRQDQMDDKIGHIGNILDRLTRLETKVEGFENKK